MFNILMLWGTTLLHQGFRTMSKFTGIRGHARIAVVTFTDEEHDAGRLIFGCETNIPATSCWAPKASTQQPYDLDLVHVRAERSNGPAQEHVQSVIGNFKPSFILTCGTAGARKNNSSGPMLGDLVIGEYIQYYEFAKVGKAVGKRKPWEVLWRHIAYDHPASCLRHSVTQQVDLAGAWHQEVKARRPDRKRKIPKVVAGMILSGEKVLQAYGSGEQEALLKRYDKALAVETESYGVALAVYKARSDKQAFGHHYNPLFLPIRGISDFVDVASAQSDRIKWTNYAAQSACAFARGISEHLLKTLPK